MKHAHSLGSVATPLLSAMLIGLAGASPAWAQVGTIDPNVTAPSPHDTNAAANKLHRTDAGFLKDTFEGGLAEIEAGKMALTRASHPDVKAFAQMLIDEHTKANADITALAAIKHVKLPDAPAMVDQAMLKALSLRKEGFDAHFVKSMGVNAHEKTIKRVEKFLMEAKDADVKALATKMLPGLQKHLQMARDLHARLSAKN
jgi:putative membrane protein